MIDPTDGSTIPFSFTFTPIKIGESFIQGGTGLATHPLTGELWAIVRDSTTFTGDIDLGLVTIDPFTGVATKKGQLDDFYVSLAFDSSGTLYTTTAIDAFNFPDTLFTLSSSLPTAVATPLCALNSSGINIDEKALGFTPSDSDFIYYAAGDDAGFSTFEKINKTSLPLSPTSTTCPSTTVAIPGDLETADARAITYSASEDKFLWSQGDDPFDSGPGDLFTVDPDGLVNATLNGELSHPSKGLAFIQTNSLPTAFDDLVTTDVDKPINISILSNDKDPEGDAINFTNVFDFTGLEPGASVANFTANGTVTYIPPAGFSGQDSFTYTIEDDVTDATILRFAPANVIDPETATVTVFTIKVPTILSVVANDPFTSNNGYGAGDTITITFSEPVNREAGQLLTQTQLNDTLSWDSTSELATDYDGVFETPSRLRININTISSFIPEVNVTTVTVKESANLRNAAGTSGIITDTSDTMTGDFGAIAGPILQSAVIDDPDGTLETDVAPFITKDDTVTIKFDRETNTPGGSGIQLKAAVDSLFVFFENPPFFVGENYTGQWQTTEKFVISIVEGPPADPLDFTSLKLNVTATNGIKNIANTSAQTDPANSIPVTGDAKGFSIVIVVEAGESASTTLPSGVSLEVEVPEELEGNATSTSLTITTTTIELDTDGDGIFDSEEEPIGGVHNSTIIRVDEEGVRLTNDFSTDPNNADSDGDTISDPDEINAVPQTNATNPDTDGDGFADNVELANGTDPTDENSPNPNDFQSGLRRGLIFHHHQDL